MTEAKTKYTNILSEIQKKSCGKEKGKYKPTREQTVNLKYKVYKINQGNTNI